MSDNISLNAEPRSDSGKGASRRLRHQGLVPAIVYGGKFDPVQVSIDHNVFLHEPIFSVSTRIRRSRLWFRFT